MVLSVDGAVSEGNRGFGYRHVLLNDSDTF